MSLLKIKQIEGLQDELLSGSLKSSFTQNSHGFTAGDVISFAEGSWTLADSSSAATLGRIVVESVTDTNTFIGVLSGTIEVAGWGLTAGSFYVVTEDGDGSIAPINENTASYAYSNPVLQALSSSVAHVLPWRPSESGELAQGVDYVQQETPNVTNGNSSSTGITLDYTPFEDGRVEVLINGVGISEGSATKTEDVYFSADGGTNAKATADLATGDTLYWNGTIAGFELSATDKVTLIYQKSSLD